VHFFKMNIMKLALFKQEYKKAFMIRQRKYKPGDKVKLNKLSVEQNEKTHEEGKFNRIYSASKTGEVLRPETQLPENSNFRYSVRFDNDTITVNENQIDPV